MRLFDIAMAVAYPDHSGAITWSDGVSGVVDFLPIIDRGGWFTPLRDGDIFASTMVVLPGLFCRGCSAGVVLPDGAGLTWPEVVYYSADFIRRMAVLDGVPVDSAKGYSGPDEKGRAGQPVPRLVQ